MLISPDPSEVQGSDRAAIRPASMPHAERLFDIRRKAILALAPSGMPADKVREWADAHELEWMHRVLSERRVWVFERGAGCLMGWVSVSGDLIDALYVDPACARHGVGSRLLSFAEGDIAGRGFGAVRVEASINARLFYLNRGYTPVEPERADGMAIRMRKVVRN